MNITRLKGDATMPFDPTFSFFQTIFPLFFMLILGIILFQIFRGIKQWNYNNNQPVLTVSAKVTSKRTKVSRHNHHHGNHVHHHSSTHYYATFEVESGDRMELKVNDQEFSMLAEGDYGNLTFQGTRFKSFERWK